LVGLTHLYDSEFSFVSLIYSFLFKLFYINTVNVLRPLAICVALAGCSEPEWLGKSPSLLFAEHTAKRAGFVIEQSCVLRINYEEERIRASFVKGEQRGEKVEGFFAHSVDKGKYDVNFTHFFLKLLEDDPGIGLVILSQLVPNNERGGKDIRYVFPSEASPNSNDALRRLAEENCDDY